MSLSSLKITPRTLFKVRIQNKIWCVQFGKIKGMTWQNDAFSDDAWRCRMSQTQWRWMAKCSRHATQWRWMAKCSRHATQWRRMHGHQSSYDMKMVWQGQTSTKMALNTGTTRQSFHWDVVITINSLRCHSVQSPELKSKTRHLRQEHDILSLKWAES